MFGVRLICTPLALKDGDERLFPESKNRSKRIHKKLVKRFGGEFKKVPAIYRMGDSLLAHPSVFHLLKQEIANARALDNPLPFGLPPEPEPYRPVVGSYRYSEWGVTLHSPVGLNLAAV